MQGVMIKADNTARRSNMDKECKKKVKYLLKLKAEKLSEVTANLTERGSSSKSPRVIHRACASPPFTWQVPGPL